MYAPFCLRLRNDVKLDDRPSYSLILFLTFSVNSSVHYG